jgi:hypothetical protein
MQVKAGAWEGQEPTKKNREEPELLPVKLLRLRLALLSNYSTYGFQVPSLVSTTTALALAGAAL